MRISDMRTRSECLIWHSCWIFLPSHKSPAREIHRISSGFFQGRLSRWQKGDGFLGALYPEHMNFRRLSVLGALSAALACALLLWPRAEAQGTAVVQEARDVGEYAGVRPGTNNRPPRSGAAQSARGTVVTWPGFEPRGGGRFFVQTTGTIITEVHQSEGRVEVVLKNARTHLRNTRRWLETRFFNTPVRRARIERRGRNDLVFVFAMRQNAAPTVTTGTGVNGFEFLYVDFPAGDYIPQELRIAPPEPDTASGDHNNNSGNLDNLDNERPPGM